MAGRAHGPPRRLDSLSESARDAGAVLVEPRVPHAAGGSGVALDLVVAPEARVRLAGATMVLAGGLTPEPSRPPWPSFDRRSGM